MLFTCSTVSRCAAFLAIHLQFLLYVCDTMIPSRIERLMMSADGLRFTLKVINIQGYV